MITKDEIKVEYPGYCFADLGRFMENAPYHDLFKHILENPPEGYKFVQRPNEFSQQDETHLMRTIDEGWKPELEPWRKFILEWRETCRSYGVSEQRFTEFLLSRPMSRNFSIPLNELVVFPTFPLYITPNSWFIEIEDWVTLYYPYIGNGNTGGVDVHSYPCHNILKALFHQPNFKGVITHVLSTVKHLKLLFGDDFKVFYVPIGFPEQDVSNRKKPDNTVNLLFHGSFNHTDVHFFLRGGLEVLKAFRNIAGKHANLRLTVIYDEAGMIDVDPSLVKYMQSHSRIKYINRRVPEEELHQELLNADALCIPAFRLHSVTTAKALFHGVPVITSNGWGFDEYIINGYNGFIVDGQINSWTDEQGLFRECYHTTKKPIPRLVDGLSERFELLANHPEIAHQMSKNALDFAKQNLSIANRNRMLSDLFNVA